MKVVEVLFFVVVFGFLFWAIYKAIQENKSKETPAPQPFNESLYNLSVDGLIEQLKVKIAIEESKAKAGVISTESMLESYKEQLAKAEAQRDKYKHL